MVKLQKHSSPLLMKLLMKLFSKNSSTGEAELCQTGPIFFKTEDQLYIQTPENISGKKDKIIGEREKRNKIQEIPHPAASSLHSLSPPLAILAFSL
jgi:hypothetical protein